MSKLFTKQAELNADTIVHYAFQFAQEYDREYGSAGFSKSFLPENQLTRILIDKALNSVPNCSKNDAYEIAISATKILETMGINPVAVKTGAKRYAVDEGDGKSSYFVISPDQIKPAGKKIGAAAPPSTFKQALIKLRPQMAAAAQNVYDEWEPDEEGDDVFGGGGICDAISGAIAGVIVSHMDANTAEGGQDGDDHAWTIAYSPTEASEVYGVDIHPYVYERGSGYSWTKIPGVRFDADDVEIFPVDVSAEDLNKYSSCIECKQKISKKASASGTVFECGCGKQEYKTSASVATSPEQKAREEFGAEPASQARGNPRFIWSDGAVTSGMQYHENIACYAYDEDPKAFGVSP